MHTSANTPKVLSFFHTGITDHESYETIMEYQWAQTHKPSTGQEQNYLKTCQLVSTPRGKPGNTTAYTDAKLMHDFTKFYIVIIITLSPKQAFNQSFNHSQLIAINRRLYCC